jgi:hypothetical protein
MSGSGEDQRDHRGGDGRRNLVIANAMDDAPPDVRHASVEQELAALPDLGLDGAELDLRDYFAHQHPLWQWLLERP